MLDRLRYVSSSNREIRFGEGNIIINTNNFRDYEWGTDWLYDKIANFKYGMAEKSLPILLYGDVKNTANTIFEIVEYDTKTKQYGKLYSGDYYMQGYFVASEKTNYTADGFLKFNLTFVTDKPYWIKENIYTYRQDSVLAESVGGLGYPYDYSYGFLSDINTTKVVNPSLLPQNAKIVIYGACINPVVLIDDYEYHLNLELDDDEYVTINTADKTIIKTDAQGTQTNVFSSRGRTSYIFQKIPSGEHIMSVLPETNIDVVVLEERSEPKW